jgi:hypothetical protein
VIFTLPDEIRKLLEISRNLLILVSGTPLSPVQIIHIFCGIDIERELRIFYYFPVFFYYDFFDSLPFVRRLIRQKFQIAKEEQNVANQMMARNGR